MNMRRAARIDQNQPAIIKALEQTGALVTSLAAIGGGVADLLVLAHGELFLLEVKNPAKPKRDRQLTPDQINWHKLWPVTVVETIESAIAAIQA